MCRQIEEAAAMHFAEVGGIDDHGLAGVEGSSSATLELGEEGGVLGICVGAGGEEFATDGIALEVEETEETAEATGKEGLAGAGRAGEEDQGCRLGPHKIVVSHRMC
jgi:hypothetical protein